VDAVDIQRITGRLDLQRALQQNVVGMDALDVLGAAIKTIVIWPADSLVRDSDKERESECVCM
jgi:hypothetical protein